MHSPESTQTRSPCSVMLSQGLCLKAGGESGLLLCAVAGGSGLGPGAAKSLAAGKGGWSWGPCGGGK